MSIPTPKGTKFSDEHVANLLASRAKSPRWADGRKRAARKGRRPPLRTIAASLATRTLRAMGLDRTTAPAIWEAYFGLYTNQLEEKHGEQSRLKPRPPDPEVSTDAWPAATVAAADRPAASRAMYPSLSEILAAVALEIPPEIVEEMRTRYDAHGWEYAAPREMFGGTRRRPVNMCMLSDSHASAREELIDAVFNLGIALFKEERDWRAKSALLYVLGALHLLPSTSENLGQSTGCGGLSVRDTASGIAKSS